MKINLKTKDIQIRVESKWYDVINHGKLVSILNCFLRYYNKNTLVFYDKKDPLENLAFFRERMEHLKARIPFEKDCKFKRWRKKC